MSDFESRLPNWTTNGLFGNLGGLFTTSSTRFGSKCPLCRLLVNCGTIAQARLES